MSRIALGTAQFGLNYGVANNAGRVCSGETNAILEVAKKNSIDVLDTAILYGDSEKTLGQLGTSGFKIITKLPALPEGQLNAYDWVRQQAQDSLNRLGVKSLYGLLLHRPNQLLEKNGAEIYRGLQSLKSDALVNKIGLSIYSSSELFGMFDRYKFDIIQAPFNLIDRELDTSGWMDRLKDLDVEIHSRSAFLQGLLLMNEADIPTRFFAWRGLFKKWHRWVEEFGCAKLEACMAFPLQYPQIDRVIVGVDTASQLSQIIEATGNISINNFPDIQSSDQNLINPANWSNI
ncbi:aldo/keto reductase [Amylibacter sp.]|nr:aldo/keto reductase [Amylibacter sp.]